MRHYDEGVEEKKELWGVPGDDHPQQHRDRPRRQHVLRCTSSPGRTSSGTSSSRDATCTSSSAPTSSRSTRTEGIGIASATAAASAVWTSRDEAVFFCLSNAQSYVLSVPDVLDIWNMPCAWRGRTTSTARVSSLRRHSENDAVKSLLTTGRTRPRTPRQDLSSGPPPRSLQYAETFDGQFMLPTKTAEAPAGSARAVRRGAGGCGGGCAG